MLIENQHRTNSEDLSSSSIAIITSADPLIQSCDDQPDEIKNYTRRSIVFSMLNTNIIRNDDESTDPIKPRNSSSRCYSSMQRFSGIMYGISASFLFSSTNYTMQRLDVILLDVFLIRFFIQGVISIGFILYKGYQPFSNSHCLLLFVRSIIAAAGSIFFYLGLETLPLPDLMTIRYTQIIWTAILALIIFRERITMPVVVASILTLIGVIVVAQPSFLFAKLNHVNVTSHVSSIEKKDRRPLGVTAALLCAISVSTGIVLTKKLIRKQVRQSVILFHFILSTFTMLLVSRIYYWTYSKTNRQQFSIKNNYLTKNFILATILATSQIIPMVFTQKSIKREHPSVVTIVQAAEILFALIFHNIFSQIKSNRYTLMGATLVLTSIVIIGFHKIWLDRKYQIRISTPIEPRQ